MPSLTSLQTLNLRGCKSLTDVSGLSGLPGLQPLNLSGCKSLTDVSPLSGRAGLVRTRTAPVKNLDRIATGEPTRQIERGENLPPKSGGDVAPAFLTFQRLAPLVCSFPTYPRARISKTA